MSGMPLRRYRSHRSITSSIIDALLAAATVGVEAHLDLLHGLYPHAVGHSRFHTDAVLRGRIDWPTPRGPDARRSRGQIAGREQRLDTPCQPWANLGPTAPA